MAFGVGFGVRDLGASLGFRGVLSCVFLFRTAGNLGFRVWGLGV